MQENIWSIFGELKSFLASLNLSLVMCKMTGLDQVTPKGPLVAVKTQEAMTNHTALIPYKVFKLLL